MKTFVSCRGSSKLLMGGGKHQMDQFALGAA